MKEGIDREASLPAKVQDAASKKQERLSRFKEEALGLKRHLQYSVQRERRSHKELTWKKLIARDGPLLAALMAPLSTLFDIPGFSQQWYTLNGHPVQDEIGSRYLSAFGLAFNAIASALLLFRFSSHNRWWKSAMISSTVCWTIKTVLATVNLGMYAGVARVDSRYSYTQGFWCALFSGALAGITAIILISVAWAARKGDAEQDSSVRVQAAHFLLTEMLFFILISLEALILSRIEGTWSYFDAIYFSITTALTVGFGDLAPRKLASRALVFPFAVLTIAGLAAQVSTIIDLFASRTEARKEGWRVCFEEEQEQERPFVELDPKEELITEMKHLFTQVKQENAFSRMYDLCISLVAFVLFWFLGAMVFHFLEGWSYGSSLYFCYVFFLTIGYGDFAPSTACGRVFFVFYALMSVPIVASFAVQSISQIMVALNEARLNKQKRRMGTMPELSRLSTIEVAREANEEGDKPKKEEVSPFISHAELVETQHKLHKEASSAEKQKHREHLDYREGIDSPNKGVPRTGQLGIPASNPSASGTGPNLGHSDFALLDELLVHMLTLEEICRKVLISKLPSGSQSRVLLQADKHAMQRAVDLHRGLEQADRRGVPRREPRTDDHDLEDVTMYRESFAKLLVVASRLKRLDGVDQLLFERRREGPD